LVDVSDGRVDLDTPWLRTLVSLTARVVDAGAGC
jgi:hypothetical protein